MAEYKTELGKRILRCRNELGMTQEEFGASVGMSQKQISQIENGEREILARNLAKIAITFNIPACYLLLGVEEELPSLEKRLKYTRWLREGITLFGDKPEEMK